MDDVVKEFLVESYENLDEMDRDLVELEQNPKPEDIARIFRTFIRLRVPAASWASHAWNRSHTPRKTFSVSSETENSTSMQILRAHSWRP